MNANVEARRLTPLAQRNRHTASIVVKAYVTWRSPCAYVVFRCIVDINTHAVQAFAKIEDLK